MFPPSKTRPFSAILLFRRKRKPGGRSAHCQELRGTADSSTVYGCHKPNVARLGAGAGDKSDRAAGSYVKFARPGVAWLPTLDLTIILRGQSPVPVISAIPLEPTPRVIGINP